MWQPRRAGFLLMDEGNLWKGRMAKTEMATSKNPQHFPPPPPPLLFTAEAAAATKVVVCFVFVKLCIL